MPDVGKITGTLDFQDKASAKIDGFTNKLKSINIGWQAVAAGAVIAAAAIGKSMKAFDEQVNSINKLNLALANQGNFTKEASDRIQKLASAQQNLTTFGDELTLSAAASGAQMGLNADQIEALLPLVQDYAAAMGKDLNTAFMDVGKSVDGQISTLARYGIKTNEAMSETERMAVVVEGLTSKFSGSAALAAETFSGKLAQISNAVGDVFEQVGLFINYLTGSFGGGVSSSLSILQKLGDFFGKTLPTVVSEARAQFALLLANIFELVAIVKSLPGANIIVPGLALLPDADALKEMAKGQRELADEVRDEADAFVAAGIAGRDFANNIGGSGEGSVAGSIEKASGKLTTFNKMLEDGAVYWRKQQEEVELFAAASKNMFPDQGVNTLDIGIGAFEGSGTLKGEIQESIDLIGVGLVTGVGDVEDAIKKAEKEQQNYNIALQQAANIAQIIPGFFGQILSSTISMAGSLKNLTSGGGGIMGGLKDAFNTGKGGEGGIMGLLGGIGGLASAAGPLISMGMTAGKAIVGGIKKLLSIGGPDIARDVARDMGPKISEELEKSIKESGKPVQLAIADVFREGFASGSATADMLAEEMGDLFSGFSRGEFGEGELVGALESSVPMLIERLNELGPAGEEQLNRIINAAQEMGVEFEGLSELIEGTFAPETMENIAEQFGITNEEVRALAEKLGVDVQTNLERMASQLGLSVDEFKNLGAAVEEEFGIPMEDIEALMKSLGVTAEELAAALGVEVSAGAEDLDESLEKNTSELTASAAQAERMAAALAEAAAWSKGIEVPSFPGGMPPGAAEGAVTDRPQIRTIGEAGPEVVAPVRALFGSLGDDIANKVKGIGGGNLSMNNTFNFGGSGGNEDIINYIENNMDQSMTRIFRRAKETGNV